MKEMFYVNKQGRKDRGFVPVFLISLALAMLFMVMNQSELLLQSDVLSESALSLVKGRSGDNGSLFLCVLRERIWTIPILFLISTTHLAAFMVYGTLVWYGVSMGALLAMAMLRYRLAGVFLLIVCGLPQYLFYVPAILIALRVSGEQREPDKKFFMQLIVLEGVILAGCLAECYVNSFLIEKIIKFFLRV